MREMMLREKQLLLLRIKRTQVAQLPFDHPAQKQLFTDPPWHRRCKRADATGNKVIVGLKKTLKFQQRLVVKDNQVNVRQLESAVLQAKADCLRRKVGVVLFSRKPFFLRGGDDLAVAEQSRSRIMIKSRQPQYVHGGI